MKEKEFNLSEKIICEDKEIEYEGEIKVEDVKEFIRRLKKEFETMPNTRLYAGIDIMELIDKLAGDKLI